MKGERGKLYSTACEFYDLEGSVVMKLTPEAAIQVCLTAVDYQLVVARIEGGIWHHPGFEARLDCIWNGMDPPLSDSEAKGNNHRAAEYIEKQSNMHDVFILTAPPITGWPHKKRRPELR